MDAKEQDWTTIGEVAGLLKIPLTRCYDLFHSGDLPGAVRIGERSIRVNRRELERVLLQGRRVVQR